MAYLDRIAACNGWEPEGFLPLRVDAACYGWIKRGLATYLTDWEQVFHVTESEVVLDARETDCAGRTRALACVLEGLVRQGVLPALHGERYAVGPVQGEPLLLIDREAASWFGTRAYGQHMNGYVRDGDDLRMWIGRRARDKRHFPGKLDHLVAGGMPHGISPAANLAKECWEEAGIGPELAAKARPVGSLTYCRETETGLKPDTVYCYDLELPAEFQPRCTDGEVEEFQLMPMHEVRDLVRDTDVFKPNCSLVIIDFLIRHGWLGPETEDYLDIVAGLHPRLP